MSDTFDSTAAYIRSFAPKSLNGLTPRVVDAEENIDPRALDARRVGGIASDIPWGSGAYALSQSKTSSPQLAEIGHVPSQAIDGLIRRSCSVAHPNAPFSDQITRIKTIRQYDVVGPASGGWHDAIAASKDISRKAILRQGLKPGWFLQGVRFDPDRSPSSSSDLYIVSEIIGDAMDAFIRGVCQQSVSSRAASKSMLNHTIWWRGKLQGSTTFRSNDPGFELVTSIGVSSWVHGSEIVDDLGSTARQAAMIPSWYVNLNITLTRGGNMRRVTQSPYIAGGWLGAPGGYGLSLGTTGYENCFQRNRVVTNPPPEQSISVLPVVAMEFFIGMEADHLRLTGREAAWVIEAISPLASAAVADLWAMPLSSACDQLQAVPGFPAMHPVLIALLYGPRSPDDIALASDQEKQDQHGFRYKLKRERLASLSNCASAVQHLTRHVGDVGANRRALESNCRRYLYPEKWLSIEPSLWPTADATVSLSDHGLRSGEPGTKKYGTKETVRTNTAALALAVADLGGNMIKCVNDMMSWWMLPLRTLRHTEEYETRLFAGQDPFTLGMNLASFLAGPQRLSAYSWGSRWAGNGDDWMMTLTRSVVRDYWCVKKPDQLTETWKKHLEACWDALGTVLTTADFCDYAKTDMATGMPCVASRILGHIAPEYENSQPLMERSGPARKAYSDKLNSWLRGPDSPGLRLSVGDALLSDRRMDSSGRHIISDLIRLGDELIKPDVWNSIGVGRASSLTHAVTMLGEGSAQFDSTNKLPSDRWWMKRSELEEEEKNKVKLLGPDRLSHRELAFGDDNTLRSFVIGSAGRAASLN